MSIALQEADGADAARLVFPNYEFCFTGRKHVQNTGFAVRRGVAFRCGPDDRELSLGDTLPAAARNSRCIRASRARSGC